MPNGQPNKRYTPEFKKLVVETMHEEKLSYYETDRRFGLPDKRAQKWERIYLEEETEGFAVERRGRSSKGRPRKLPKETEEDLIAEVQRLRAENGHLILPADQGHGVVKSRILQAGILDGFQKTFPHIKRLLLHCFQPISVLSDFHRYR